MDEFTAAAHGLEDKVIQAINDSHLPAAFVEYVLRNILMQVQNAERNQQPAENEEAEEAKEGGGQE